MIGSSREVPVWKKDLMARLRANNKCTGNEAVTVCGRQLSPPYRSESSGRAPKHSHQTSVGIRPTTCNQLSSAPSGAASAVKNETSATKFISPLTRRKTKPSKMVQERVWSGEYNSWESGNSENDDKSRTSDSDSSEELHYGPGIVNKLKNKYLSLTLHRETHGKQRPNLRKATSLENMLDEDDVDDGPEKINSEPLRNFRTNGTDRNASSNRYRHSKRGVQDMKRARSMEAISRFENIISPPPPPAVDKPRPKSMHECLLIADLEEGNDKYRKQKDNKVAECENNTNGIFSNNYVPRLNRPKRIAPVMNEREKPPADVVKQAKMIFEKRPEQRTKPPVNTGEVAAKVASYKSIIVQSKQAKKPPVKTKPVGPLLPKNGTPKPLTNNTPIEDHKPKVGTKSKPETPKKTHNGTDLEAPKISPRIRGTSRKIQTPPTSPLDETKSAKDGISFEFTEKPQKDQDKAPKLAQLAGMIPDVSIVKTDNDITGRLCHTPDLIMTITPMAVSIPSNPENNHNECFNVEILESVTSNCSASQELPQIGESSAKVPISEPLKLIINNNRNTPSPQSESSPRITEISPILPTATRRKIVSPPIRPLRDPVVLEKNLINAAKSEEKGGELFVPKKVRRPPREPETNSIVFKFTDRKDVPDYVQNDKSRTAGRIERPKVGEGGIIVLPGAAIDESFTDEDEEIRKCLQAPPSPCDVTFINDNILIDGKSSIRQKTKTNQMRISFVESGPDVFEYPSESSLLIDESTSSVPASPPLTGHTVPNLTGSYLANYIPKATEEFQPGVTRSAPATSPPAEQIEEEDELLLEELDEPVTFSAGTNSDMLF